MIVRSTLVATAVAALAVPPARAAESYDNCAGTIASLPATITTQGVWCLKSDLSTAIASGDAITIDTNNVTIDCNDFKIGGLAAGSGTLAVGIRIASRLNATVRGCTIRGFHTGIVATAGGAHRIADNRFDGNTVVGLRVESPGSQVLRNLVADTGGSTASASEVSTSGIQVGQAVDVIDNVVAGVYPTAVPGRLSGIYSINNDDGTIAGNRVRGVQPPDEDDSAYGILDLSTPGTVIRDNVLVGPGNGVPRTTAIYCGGSVLTTGNATVRFETNLSPGCLSTGDVADD